MSVWNELAHWLTQNPARQPPRRSPRAQFHVSGAPLIEAIAGAIGADQSVLLVGPRGCGKSRCVAEGIKRAVALGYLRAEASHAFLQGNREIPRDALIEDEVIFLVQPTDDGEVQVVPERVAGALFRFVPRLPNGQPAYEIVEDKRYAICRTEPRDAQSPRLQRFALFLDEINRFSDGILDALLSVLEERKAVLGGQEYYLPVTVCMTMNPPGYDATARRLSPPLAARITRTFRLSTPDLDALADHFMAERIENDRQAFQDARLERERAAMAAAQAVADAAKKPRTSRPAGLLVSMVKPGGGSPEAAGAASPAQTPLPASAAAELEYPQDDPMMQRKVALVTLCLWGVPPVRLDSETFDPKLAGMEYLTPATQALLRALATEDPELGAAMREVQTLSHFGPDGRAAGDWFVAATGAAISEARGRGKTGPAELAPRHFYQTLIETIAHKVYDTFSPAIRPDLVERKEELVRQIAQNVLERSAFPDDPNATQVVRLIDDPVKLTGLYQGFTAKESVTHFVKLRRCHIRAGLTKDRELTLWTSWLKELGLADLPQELGQWPESALGGVLVDPGQNTPDKTEEPVGWASTGFRDLAVQFHETRDKSAPPNARPQSTLLTEQIGKNLALAVEKARGIVPPVEDVLAPMDAVWVLGTEAGGTLEPEDTAGIEVFKKICQANGIEGRAAKLALADLLQSCWNLSIPLDASESTVLRTAASLSDTVKRKMAVAHHAGDHWPDGARELLVKQREWQRWRSGRREDAHQQVVEDVLLSLSTK